MLKRLEERRGGGGEKRRRNCHFSINVGWWVHPQNCHPLLSLSLFLTRTCGTDVWRVRLCTQHLSRLAEREREREREREVHQAQLFVLSFVCSHEFWGLRWLTKTLHKERKGNGSERGGGEMEREGDENGGRAIHTLIGGLKIGAVYIRIKMCRLHWNLQKSFSIQSKNGINNMSSQHHKFFLCQWK